MKMLRSSLRALLLAVAGLAGVRIAQADDAAALLDRIRAADAHTSLDVAGIKPWHLKLTVQLFDSKGNPTDHGTMEEWWASPDQDRREYKMGSYSATEIRTSGNTYRTKGADLPPYYLELLRNQIVHPVQSLPTSKPRFPRLRKAGDSKTPLECIALKWNKDASEQEASNYCFGSKSDDLAILTDYTYQTIAREAIGDFQGRRVSVSTTVSYNRIKAATARIESLASAPIPDAEFEITPDLDLRTPLFVSSGADDALIEPISRPDGDYPDLVQTGDNAVGIMLRCVIGKDGLVRKIEVVGATNPKFVDAAVASLRRWKYEPIVWNGQPAEAEITVVVDIHRD